MLSDALTRRLVTRQQQRLAALGDRQGRIAIERWLSMSSHDAEDIAEWVRLVAPTITATRAASTRLGSALYSTILQVRPVTIEPPEIPDELREPFIAYWRALNSGYPEPEAVASGAARAGAIVHNAAVSTSRRSGDAVARANSIEPSWRRMTDGKACSWCSGLTSDVFPSSEAADFGHDYCGCTPIPA